MAPSIKSLLVRPGELGIVMVAAPMTLLWLLTKRIRLASLLRRVYFTIAHSLKSCDAKRAGKDKEPPGVPTRCDSPAVARSEPVQVDYLDHVCCPVCRGGLRLIVGKQHEDDAVGNALECVGCERHFPIRDGLASLCFPEVLEKGDLASQRFYDERPKYDFRLTAFRLGIWNITFRDRRNRSLWPARLEVGEGASVLETGAGTGENLPFIADAIGKDGRLDAMDISLGSLKVARERMRHSGIQTTLMQGNASYLPYRSAQFDAVLHVGGFNEFGDKKRAIDEMHRVAKAGAKVVLCDEGLSPERKESLLGRYILRCADFYANKPPVDLLPRGIEEYRLSWMCQETFWVIEYRKAGNENKQH